MPAGSALVREMYLVFDNDADANYADTRATRGRDTSQRTVICVDVFFMPLQFGNADLILDLFVLF